MRVKSLQEENKSLRQASVNIQAKAKQEEEYLTNDSSRRLNQLRQEKVQLEHTLEQKQECLVNRLMRKIEKLETETGSRQATLDQLQCSPKDHTRAGKKQFEEQVTTSDTF